jgi:hypothetical protein
MTVNGFRPLACLLLAINVVRPQPPASPAQREPLRMLKEYRRHALGLMDISADGRLLLMHETLREKSRSSDARLHRLRVIDEPSGREIAALKFETAEPRTMLFLPSGHEVLVSGLPIEPAAGRGFLLWDPHTGRFRALGALDPAGFTFIQFLDDVRILGQRSGDPGGNPYVSYDLRSGTTMPFDIRSGEGYDYSMWERGLTFSPDRTTVVGKARATLTFRQLGSDAPPRRLQLTDSFINSYVFSPDGRLFIVISRAATPSEAKERTAYLSVYETANLQRVLHQPILSGESTGSTGIENIGYQLGLSPDGQWLVVGYDRLTSKLLFFNFAQAKYAIYELRSGRHVGTVDHPPVKMPLEYTGLSAPVQSGRLKFGPNGRSFYTTSEFSRQWQLPGR